MLRLANLQQDLFARRHSGVGFVGAGRCSRGRAVWLCAGDAGMTQNAREVKIRE